MDVTAHAQHRVAYPLNLTSVSNRCCGLKGKFKNYHKQLSSVHYALLVKHLTGIMSVCGNILYVF